MRFFLDGVPIDSAVSACFPCCHAYGFFTATFENSAYSLADSLLFSAIDCPRWARNPFSYNGYTWVGRPIECVAPRPVDEQHYKESIETVTGRMGLCSLGSSLTFFTDAIFGTFGSGSVQFGALRARPNASTLIATRLVSNPSLSFLSCRCRKRGSLT